MFDGKEIEWASEFKYLGLTSQPPTYAGEAKKHLLIVKSTDNSHRSSEKKREISAALKGLRMVDAKFKESGNVILNFESEHQRNEAAAKVGELDNVCK